MKETERQREKGKEGERVNSDVDLHLRAHNGLRNKTITVVIKIITVGAAADRSRERGQTYNTDDNSAPNDGSACACLASLFGGMPPSFLSSWYLSCVDSTRVLLLLLLLLLPLLGCLLIRNFCLHFIFLFPSPTLPPSPAPPSGVMQPQLSCIVNLRVLACAQHFNGLR